MDKILFSFDAQNSVKIRTEDGLCLEISPTTHYSEDFEPYESVDMEVVTIPTEPECVFVCVCRCFLFLEEGL